MLCSCTHNIHGARLPGFVSFLRGLCATRGGCALGRFVPFRLKNEGCTARVLLWQARSRAAETRRRGISTPQGPSLQNRIDYKPALHRKLRVRACFESGREPFIYSPQSEATNYTGLDLDVWTAVADALRWERGLDWDFVDFGIPIGRDEVLQSVRLLRRSRLPSHSFVATSPEKDGRTGQLGPVLHGQVLNGTTDLAFCGFVSTSVLHSQGVDTSVGCDSLEPSRLRCSFSAVTPLPHDTE